MRFLKEKMLAEGFCNPATLVKKSSVSYETEGFGRVAQSCCDLTAKGVEVTEIVSQAILGELRRAAQDNDTELPKGFRWVEKDLRWAASLCPTEGDAQCYNLGQVKELVLDRLRNCKGRELLAVARLLGVNTH